MSLIHRRGTHILLPAFIAVIMVIAVALPVFAQQGSQIQLTDFLDENSDCPDIAIDSQNNVHIVFEEDAGTSGNYGEIWYIMLDSNGSTLIDETPINQDGYQRKPAIGVDSQDQLHLVWQRDSGDHIAYTKLDPYLDDRDGDAANLATIELVTVTDLYGGEKQLDPRIAIDSSDNVHVVWGNHDDTEIAYMKLNSTGSVLVSYTNIADTNNQKRLRPFVAVDSNDNPHIIWNDNSGPGPVETFYAMLNGSNGNHLITATLITDDDDWGSSRSDVVVDGEDKVHVFWSEEVDSDFREIFYTKLDPSLDDQDDDAADESVITVIEDIILTTDDGWRSTVPQAAYQCGYIHVTWKDDRVEKNEDPDEEPPADVFYMVIDTDGSAIVPETALTTVKKLGYTHEHADNVIPVAVDENGKAHIAWCDYRADDEEIWYTSYQGLSCTTRPVGGEAYPVKTVGVIALLTGLIIATATGIHVRRFCKVN